MRWLLLIAFAGLVGAGCKATVYKTHEGQFCSSNKDDDPFFECSRASDLVCITTYTMTYSQPNNAPPKRQAMYLCRIACTPGVKTDCIGEEVCCPGMIVGRDYGKTHACTLPAFCNALAEMPRDAGTPSDAARDTNQPRPDGGPNSEVGAETGEDAGDAGSDVPLAPADGGAG